MPKGNIPVSYASGVVQSRQIARVIAQVDVLAARGSNACMLHKYEDGQWSSFRLRWTATRMWTSQEPELQVFAVGPDGRVIVLTLQGSSEEQIDPSPNGPPARGQVRDLRGIGGGLYACGMNRQVYRRIGAAVWERRDDGVVLARPARTQVAGFNAIDGLHEDDIIAVGYGGEIWRSVQGRWRQIESPTNLILHRVRIIRDGLAYAAGQKGVLLRGHGDRWAPIRHDATSDNLWGMEWFAGALYVASESAIFRLTEGDHLENVSEPDLEYCGHLSAADDVMWSFGTKQVAWTTDGTRWHDVTP